MRKRDKILIMVEANKRLEKSWLVERNLIEENTNIDNLLHNNKVESMVDELINNPKELKKAINDLLSLGVNKEDLIKTAKTLQKGGSINQLTKNIVNNIDLSNLNEGEDSFIDKKIDSWSRETVSKDKLTRMLAGAKMGATLGGLGGSLIASGLFVGGMIKNPTELLLTALLGIISSAIVGSQATK